MKKILIFLLFLFFTALFMNSCKKEISCENCLPGSQGSNKPPIAQAGNDQVLALPKDSILLDGSGSSDSDGNITAYHWTKISGPSSFIIKSSSSSITVVKSLVAGNYLFELKVTDNGGLSSKDTLRVTVDAVTSKHPPIANAGDDRVIVSPLNTVTLDGTGSSDPDNDIASYQWGKINGPLSFNVVSSHSSQTQVSALVIGIYKFELIVTDATGLSDRDTVEVKVQPSSVISACGGTRPLLTAQLIPYGNIVTAREQMAVASAADKIVFAGGATSSGSCSNLVSILNTTTNTWTTVILSNPGCEIKTAVQGNKIFFAGGDGYYGMVSSTIDIYDASTNSWSTTNVGGLATRSWVDGGIAVGNKVLFTSGNFFSTPYNNAQLTFVDIYDMVNGTWDSDTLYNRTHAPPQWRLSDAGMAMTAIGNKAYIAGNASDWYAWDLGTISAAIDVYDATTSTWSTVTNLHQKRGFMAATSVGNKNIWAGGLYKQPFEPFSTEVEIRDMSTGISTFSCLFQPNAFFSVVQKGNQLVFFTSSVNAPSYFAVPPDQSIFDIYDLSSNSWSVGQLPVSIRGAAIISVNNTIYIAGGFVNGVLSDQVWKLNF